MDIFTVFACSGCVWYDEWMNGWRIDSISIPIVRLGLMTVLSAARKLIRSSVHLHGDHWQTFELLVGDKHDDVPGA